jgi:translation initiation factor 1A
MVKNTTGGNKQKSQARKFSQPSKQSSKLRVVEDEGEEYAQVTSLLGNGMCYVECDGSVKLCIIRGKFRGRGKRDNIIKKGSWVLVGIREWENAPTDKKSHQKCDLLEVYSDYDKERLKQIKGPWKQFIANDNEFSFNDEATFDFTDQAEEEYVNLVGTQRPQMTMLTLQEDAAEEEINVDDI